MATIIDTFTQIDIATTSTMTAPLIGGASAFTTFNNNQGGTGGTTTSAPTGTHGGRIAFVSPSSDFTAGTGIFFQMSYISFNSPNNWDTLANGGLSIYFVDSSGSWVKYHLGGSDVFGGAQVAGSWSAFAPMGSLAANAFYIDRNRTPDDASGVIDWTDVDALELHIKTVNVQTISMYISRINVLNTPTIIGGDAITPASMADFGAYQSGWPNFTNKRMYASQTIDFMGANGNTYVLLSKFSIGDGITPCYWVQLGGQLACYASRDAQQANPLGNEGYMVGFNGDGSPGQGRIITINQTATCHFYTDGFTWSGVEFPGGEFSVRFAGIQGSTYEHVNTLFINGYEYDPQYCNTSACIFDNWELVRLGTGSMVSAIFRNGSATSEGLLISGPGGDYSGATCRHLASNLGKSVSIDPPAAIEPPYDITGQSIESGHTLTIHNKSAINPLTVVISRDIFNPGDYVTTTAGGAVAVESTPEVAGIKLENWKDGRVWLVNNTTASTVEEVVTGAAGYEKTWLNGTDFSDGDSGTAYFLSINDKDTLVNFIATEDTIQENLSTPEVDNVYPYYVTVRGKTGEDVYNEGVFQIDGTNVQFDINDPDGIYSLMEFYMWIKYARWFVPGAIQTFWGGVIAIDTARLVLDVTRVNGYFDNLQATPARYDRSDDVSLVRSDGEWPAIVPTTGGGAITVNEGDIQIVSQDLELLKVRFDISSTTTQKYANDGSSITSSAFSLIKTDNGDGTFSMVNS